jgi:hypothetical protein
MWLHLSLLTWKPFFYDETRLERRRILLWMPSTHIRRHENLKCEIFALKMFIRDWKILFFNKFMGVVQMRHEYMCSQIWLLRNEKWVSCLASCSKLHHIFVLKTVPDGHEGEARKKRKICKKYGHRSSSLYSPSLSSFFPLHPGFVGINGLS